jgi:hypothetical protein
MYFSAHFLSHYCCLTFLFYKRYSSRKEETRQINTNMRVLSNSKSCIFCKWSFELNNCSMGFHYLGKIEIEITTRQYSYSPAHFIRSNLNSCITFVNYSLAERINTLFLWLGLANSLIIP